MPKLSLSLPALDLPEVRFAVTTAHVAQVVREDDFGACRDVVDGAPRAVT